MFGVDFKELQNFRDSLNNQTNFEIGIPRWGKIYHPIRNLKVVWILEEYMIRVWYTPIKDFGQF